MTATSPPRWLADLAPFLDSVKIESEDGFVMDGEQITVDRRRPIDADGLIDERDPLLRLLTETIYLRWYAGWRSPPFRDDGEDTVGPAVRQSLAAANAAVPHWEEGWRVCGVRPGGTVIARRGECTRTWGAGQYIVVGGPMAPKEGHAIRVFKHHESWTLQPGCYFAFGPDNGDDNDTASTVRVYFNLKTDGVALIAFITSTFPRHRVPYSLKCFSGRAARMRSDAAVLYIGARYAHLALDVIASGCSTLRAHLAERTPLFARRLAPGIALAEEPHTGESFGAHRSHAVAEGLCAAYRRGLHGRTAREAEILAAFQAHGIALAEPYLNAEPFDPFALRTLEFPNE
jgi:hypothetical protein